MKFDLLEFVASVHSQPFPVVGGPSRIWWRCEQQVVDESWMLGLVSIGRERQDDREEDELMLRPRDETELDEQHVALQE
jgi:hypothetical protein